MRRTEAVLNCLAVLFAVYSGATVAQGAADFPSRPVTLVLPYPPGGASDPEIRLYAQKLTENTGAQFLVENRPGAGTTIGMAYVMKAAPNGHTLLALNSTISVIPLIYKDFAYDTARSLVPIVQMSARASLLLVNASLPVQNVREFVAHARANPGKLNYGTSGVGGITHLVAEWFKEASGSDITVVQYKGTGPMTADMLAGRVHIGMGSVLPSKPYIASGKLRMLAASGAERIKILPELPTIVEQGVPGFDFTQWSGFAATGATPAAIVTKLNTEMVRVARDPVIAKKLEDDGYNMVGGTPDQLRRHIVAETTRWRKVVETTGIKLEE